MAYIRSYTAYKRKNRIWTVYEPYMFQGVKKLQAFEGLKISDFRHNLLIHQLLCFIIMEGNVNGSSGGPGGGGASEVTAVTASATSSAVVIAVAAAAGMGEVCSAGMQKNPLTSSTHQLAGSYPFVC